MADTFSPLLNLDTLISRFAITIDGARYELRRQEELPLIPHRRLDAQRDAFNAILTSDDPTAEQQAELSRLIGLICTAILIAPEHVLARLSDQQRMAVADVFFRLRPSPLKAGDTRQGTARPKTSTGASSPRSSRGSTAAP